MFFGEHKFPRFNREEELKLLRRYRLKGDQEAYQLLYLSQVPWSVKLGSIFMRTTNMERMGSLHHDETISEAQLGIVDALRSFDINSGYRLSTLTAKCIKNRLSRMDRGGPIRLPINKIGANQKKLISAMTVFSIGHNDEKQGRTRGNNTRLGNDPPDELIDFHSNLDDGCEIARIVEELAKLPPRLQRVIRGRYLEGKSLRMMGIEMHISRERVRQIEAEAIRLLQKRLGMDPNYKRQLGNGRHT